MKDIVIDRKNFMERFAASRQRKRERLEAIAEDLSAEYERTTGKSAHVFVM